MSKKPAKPAAASDAPEAPKKRSKVKLVIFAALPVLLAGGGYAGWTMFLAAKPAEAAAPGEVAGEHGTDAIKVSAVPTEIAAETSFTHSFALSVMLAEACGRFSVPALQAASEEEARADGMLAQLSWMAAARRVAGLDPKFCGRLAGEVETAAAKATALAEAKAALEKGGAKAEAHH